MRISDWSSDVCSSDLARIAVDALVHQRMGGVQHPFDRQLAVAFLALGDVALGEFQIVENALRVGPLLEDIIILEEMIMSEGGMGDDQGLHRRAVFLHQIVDRKSTRLNSSH